MHGDTRVAVVVPAHDEERILPRTLDGIPGWVDLVVVVDDGSADRTAVVATDHARNVCVVRHDTNRGVGAAIVTGYRTALACGVDVIAVMAADDQMAPDELAGLVDPVAQGLLDYCKGERLGHPDAPRRMPPIRRAGVVVLSGLTRLLTGYPELRDSQCGYTAISAEVLRRLPLERLYERYGYPNDLLAMLADAGARVGERTVTPIYRDEASELRPLLALFTHSAVLARAAWFRIADPARSGVPRMFRRGERATRPDRLSASRP